MFHFAGDHHLQHENDSSKQMKTDCSMVSTTRMEKPTNKNIEGVAKPPQNGRRGFWDAVDEAIGG